MFEVNIDGKNTSDFFIALRKYVVAQDDVSRVVNTTTRVPLIVKDSHIQADIPGSHLPEFPDVWQSNTKIDGPYVIFYRNHRDELAARNISVNRVYWGRTEYYPDDQWLLDVVCHPLNPQIYPQASMGERTFALSELKLGSELGWGEWLSTASDTTAKVAEFTKAWLENNMPSALEGFMMPEFSYLQVGGRLRGLTNNQAADELNMAVVVQLEAAGVEVEQFVLTLMMDEALWRAARTIQEKKQLIIQ